MAQSAVVRDYRPLEIGRRRANRLVVTASGCVACSRLTGPTRGPYCCCPRWFEKQPEGRSPRGKHRSTCAKTNVWWWRGRRSVRANATLNSHFAPTDTRLRREPSESSRTAPQGREEGEGTDRKSTRLNSSHLG